ncbi:MAG: HAMP domain-containing sensor histidine kinase [Chloroflexota bacterium]|nr:HAMP domain-containing sensor histidine kinase [Chloroflexota bacterium]
MLRSLRSRLIASYVLLIAICLVIVGVILGASMLQRAAYARLRAAVVPTTLLVRNLQQRGIPPQDVIRRLDEQVQAQGLDILILSRQGEVMAATDEDWLGQRVSLRQVVSSRERGVMEGRVTAPWGTRLYFVAWPMVEPAGGDLAPRESLVALITTPWGGISAVIGDLTFSFVVASVFAFVISLVLAVIVARSIAKPLQRVTAATEQIARGNYDLVLDITSPNEVRRLAASFNSMAHQVKTSRQAQRDFVANVSHELKTPLTSIQGYSQAILDGTIRGEAGGRRAAGIIHDEAGRMRRLVEGLLDLARIESGQVVMAQKPVALRQVLGECVDNLALRAREGGITLLLDVPDLLPVLGDGDRLAQVINNLLDNALKHTTAGGKVTVGGEEVREAEALQAIEPSLAVPLPAVVVTVSDTGRGIPPEELSRIFERFYQVDKSRARERGGVGLGLAIAQEIVTAHGGRIAVQSVAGVGTKFIVALPVGGRAGGEGWSKE